MEILNHRRRKRRRNAGLSQPLLLSISISLLLSTNGIEGFVTPRIKSQGTRFTRDFSFFGMFERTDNLRRREGSTLLTAWTPKELRDKQGKQPSDYGRNAKVKGSEIKFNRLKVDAPEDLEMVTSNVTRLEMAVMSGAGLAFSVAVIYGLATSDAGVSGESTSTVIRELTHNGLDFSWIGGNGLENFLESDEMEESVGGLARVTDAVIQTAIPQSATDALAVALGEGISGVVGAVGTWSVGLLVQLRVNANEAASRMTRGSTQNSFTGAREMREELVTEALADGDYFLTRAAVQPLLQAAGIPYFQASIISVLIATIPYALVKRSSRLKEQKKGEDQIMEFLLQEEKTRKRKWNPMGSSKQATIASFKPVSSVDLEGLEDPLTYVSGSLDFVELFSDVTKWLEYDVLKKDFGGKLALNGNILGSGWESAAFGLIAALSSQIYADVIYRYTSFGSDAKKREVRRRGLDRWTNLYSRKCLSAAALFGVYDIVKAPTGNFIINLLSGGIDSCLGSNDYDFCMETYIMDNPPGASYEAELRGVFTALASLYDRVAMGELDAQVLGRSVFVSIYSLISQLAPHFTA